MEKKIKKTKQVFFQVSVKWNEIDVRLDALHALGHDIVTILPFRLDSTWPEYIIISKVK
jgi:hypothetical protein